MSPFGIPYANEFDDYLADLADDAAFRAEQFSSPPPTIEEPLLPHGLPQIRVRQLDADEAEAIGVDSTLRTPPNLLAVEVTITDGASEQSTIGLLAEARISPEHLDEV